MSSCNANELFLVKSIFISGNLSVTSPKIMLIIIVIAITMISGLMFSDINILNTLRTWRIIFLFFASISGIFGIGVALMFFVIFSHIFP